MKTPQAIIGIGFTLFFIGLFTYAVKNEFDTQTKEAKQKVLGEIYGTQNDKFKYYFREASFNIGTKDSQKWSDSCRMVLYTQKVISDKIEENK